jgi:hypothetical protein
MNAGICIPYFSSISRHCAPLPRQVLPKEFRPGSLVIVDSTGLKINGKDAWHQENTMKARALPHQKTEAEIGAP